MAEHSDDEVIVSVKRRKQSKVITKKMDSKQEANKDTQLVKMFCVDLGPYYILKYNGFQEFIKVNIPNYTLPSMKTFSEEVIPEHYNRAKEVCMKTLDSVHHVAISIEIWKWPEPVGRHPRNMLTATIHLVQHGKHVSQNLFTMEANFRSKKNLANAIRKELVKWGVFKKVVCFITNNGKNEMLLIQAADDFKVPHVICAAATINGVIEDVLKDYRFNEFEKKYKKGNADSSKSKKKDELFSWHYLYNMLEDISENNAGECNAYERNIHSECVKMLKPFVEFNNTLSSQQYVTLSCILPQIADVRSKIKNCSTRTAVAEQIKKELLGEIDKIFNRFESYPTIANATFLDPRFKKVYFTKEKAGSVQNDIINEFYECVNSTRIQQNPTPSTSNIPSEENGNILGASTSEEILSHEEFNECVNSTRIQQNPTPSTSNTTANATFLDPRFKKVYFTKEKAGSVQKDIINEFHECVNSTRIQQNPTPSTSNIPSEENGNILSASTSEEIMSHVRYDVERYGAEPTDQRDPFQYWENYNDFHKHSPANLYIMSQKYLCIPATAIPVETISGDFLWKKNDQNDINYNERRTSLEFNDIDKMLFLHSWYRNTEINN